MKSTNKLTEWSIDSGIRAEIRLNGCPVDYPIAANAELGEVTIMNRSRESGNYPHDYTKPQTEFLKGEVEIVVLEPFEI